jgi:hypothetical protein
MIERCRQALASPAAEDSDGTAVALKKTTPRILIGARGNFNGVERSDQNSERLDLDFAEFHDALVVRHAAGVLDPKTVLESNPALCKL